MIEFLTESAEQHKDLIVVTGLVNEGIVHVGSMFNLATTCLIQSGQAVPQGEGTNHEIQLAVTKIIAYRHVLEELPTGMTGELHLQGVGGNSVAAGMMLKGTS